MKRAATSGETRLNEAEFSPQLLETLNQPPSPLPRLVLYLLLGLLVGVLVWSVFGSLDIVARANGKLIPQTRLKIVQPFEGGRVSKILVKENERVKSGQTLMIMDARLTEADMKKLQHELDTVRLQLRRVEAELSGKPLQLKPGESPELFAGIHAQYQAQRNEYLHAMGQAKANLTRQKKDHDAVKQLHKKLQETLPIYIQNETAAKQLGEKGYASKMEVLERERIRIEAEQDLRAKEYEMQSLNERVTEAQERLNQIEASYQQQRVEEQVKFKNQISQLEQDQLKQTIRSELLELKAPQDGYIKDLATHTEGSVVGAGTVLMNIIPVDEPLQAEIYVDNKDVGFVHAGQVAQIKLTSYEFQKYGMLEGNVEYVSADASERHPSGSGASSDTSAAGYRAIVVLQTQYLERDGRRMDIRPGMQVTAEIKIGTRSVLDYILSPVQQAFHEAGTER